MTEQKKKTVYEVLAAVQQEISVPKGNRNEYAGYNYRSLEDINAVAKKACAKHKATYWFTDEIVPLESCGTTRWYLCATVHFAAADSEITATAYARETLNKKGMDDAQITGLASSYARKYAACALFAIDSGEEVDALDNSIAYKEDDLYAIAAEYAALTDHETFEVIEAVAATKSVSIFGELNLENHEQVKVAIGVIKSWIDKTKERSSDEH